MNYAWRPPAGIRRRLCARAAPEGGRPSCTGIAEGTAAHSCETERNAKMCNTGHVKDIPKVSVLLRLLRAAFSLIINESVRSERERGGEKTAAQVVDSAVQCVTLKSQDANRAFLRSAP
ncbi:hypothetical protein F2P81_015705 [Scophthalmus maximus]|uniref:Uncharacterized protein n=1 Tax=Scophthalmus maximus TaxID=52904 RepID=A0A6A4SGY8_SCOMX|nr:hypothetical protein F2P81_015705 [Scophthalmus maximus]